MTGPTGHPWSGRLDGTDDAAGRRRGHVSGWNGRRLPQRSEIPRRSVNPATLKRGAVGGHTWSYLVRQLDGSVSTRVSTYCDSSGPLMPR